MYRAAQGKKASPRANDPFAPQKIGSITGFPATASPPLSPSESQQKTENDCFSTAPPEITITSRRDSPTTNGSGKNNIEEENFDEALPPLAYLLPAEYIIKHGVIPSFIECKSILHPVKTWSSVPRFIFASHTWPSKFAVDDTFRTKASILRAVLLNLKGISFIWIDHSCTRKRAIQPVESFVNLTAIISKATRVVILPFRSDSLTVPPVFDLAAYTQRAWCVFELNAFMRSPSTVRIAKIVPKGQKSQVHLISLPTNDIDMRVESILETLQLLKSVVQENEKPKFEEAYLTSVPQDKDYIWEALLILNSRKTLFNYERYHGDLFVLSSAAAVVQEFDLNNALYDKAPKPKQVSKSKDQKPATSSCHNPECVVQCVIS